MQLAKSQQYRVPIDRPILPVAPYSEEEFWQRGGLYVVGLAWHSRLVVHGCDARLRLATTDHRGTDTIADLQSGRGHRLRVTANDLAGHKAGKVGGAQWRMVRPHPLCDVGAIHTSCADADRHLARIRYRVSTLGSGKLPI